MVLIRKPLVIAAVAAAALLGASCGESPDAANHRFTGVPSPLPGIDTPVPASTTSAVPNTGDATGVPVTQPPVTPPGPVGTGLPEAPVSPAPASVPPVTPPPAAQPQVTPPPAQPPVTLPPATQPPVTPPPPAQPPVTPPPPPPEEPEGPAMSVNHAYASADFQSSSLLKDLFANQDDPLSSQLCMPTTLAYEAEYQRLHRAAPLPQLKDPSAAELPKTEAAAADVRYFTTLCKTNLQVGTTVPQGVACIDAYYKEANLGLDATVIGVDAQWKSYGLYPELTVAEKRAVSVPDIRTALTRDASVIMLVGFYLKNANTGKYDRSKGHFLSVAGYDYDAALGDTEMSLTVVNPAQDYESATDGRVADKLNMKKILGTDLPNFPEYTGFLLQGTGFEGTSYVTVVESIIVFAPK